MPPAPKPSRVAPEALTLARIAISDEFSTETRVKAGRELLALRYDLGVLRGIIEREDAARQTCPPELDR